MFYLTNIHQTIALKRDRLCKLILILPFIAMKNRHELCISIQTLEASTISQMAALLLCTHLS